jgi:Zn-dependent peptidase ImmA (M78 family)/DNA-binding XRE family transcriptional regulator
MTGDDTPLALFDDSGGAGISGRFDAARLVQARQAAGLTKVKLAGAVGVTPAAIGQYEAQVMQPRAEIVARMARELGVPTEYFAAGRPLGRVDGSHAHFRSLRSTTARERDKALAFIGQVWELAFALEKRIRFPPVDLPSLEGLESVAAAHELRAHWNLGDKPVRHLVALVESRGIIVSLLTLSNVEVARVGAFSSSHLERPVIVLTPERAKSVYVHRFTVAHELGHILLHHDAVPGDPQQEREADQFAAEFLTPRSVISNLLPRTVNLARLEDLSRYWGVSVESLLLRMKETGAVSEMSIRRGYQRLNQARSAGHETPEPVIAYPGEVPAMLSDAARLAAEHGFSEADLSLELRLKPARVREILGRDDPRPALSMIYDRGRPV